MISSWIEASAEPAPSRIHRWKLGCSARAVSLPVNPMAIALRSVLFPEPLSPVKTVQPAYLFSGRSRSNSRSAKPRMFRRITLLTYMNPPRFRATGRSYRHGIRAERGEGADRLGRAFQPPPQLPDRDVEQLGRLGLRDRALGESTVAEPRESLRLFGLHRTELGRGRFSPPSLFEFVGQPLEQRFADDLQILQAVRDCLNAGLEQNFQFEQLADRQRIAVLADFAPQHLRRHEERPREPMRQLLAFRSALPDQDMVCQLVRDREALPLSGVALVHDDDGNVFALAPARDAHEPGYRS